MSAKVKHYSPVNKNKPLPDVNDFAVKVAVRINKVFTEENDKELFKWLGALVKVKDDIGYGGTKNLTVALRKLATRANEMLDRFNVLNTESR